MEHAAGDDTDRMDFFSGDAFTDFLSELAEADTASGDIGELGGESDDISGGGVGVPAEEEVWGGEVEEAEGVGGDMLAEVDDFPKHGTCGGWGGAHDGFAGFGGGDGVADGADTADARGDVGHFCEEPAFAEFFEPAEFVYVEAGGGDGAGVIELEGDFGVAFDAGDGVDGEGLAHGGVGIFSRI
ncbi:MAG: hypothetical protein RI897_3503 [Verrucomicrobiota bacterium]